MKFAEGILSGCSATLPLVWNRVFCGYYSFLFSWPWGELGKIQGFICIELADVYGMYHMSSVMVVEGEVETSEKSENVRDEGGLHGLIDSAKSKLR